MRPLLLGFILAMAGPAILPAGVIGSNPPMQPMTEARLAELPANQRRAWAQYLAESARLREADEAFLAAEVKAAGLTAALVPVKGRAPGVQRPPEFWAGPEAARVADNLVSFQTPAGGWNKNTDHATAPRRRGERFGYEAGYVGTIDNDATITQLRFLGRTLAATRGSARREVWQAAWLRGINYLITAQYPSGGWPQVFPLEGGYHDAVTYNDGAMTNVLSFLRELADPREPGVVPALPAEMRARVATALARGLDCLLASQIKVQGRRTVWCQQHDCITLAPCSARAYEMPAQATGESAGILTYLMSLPTPSPAVVAAVQAAAGWLSRTALHDIAFKPAPGGGGRQVIAVPGAGPIWARYYEIGTDRPVFGDRDRSIHDDVSEISAERRNGYAWFGDGPKRALDHYRKWAATHGVPDQRVEPAKTGGKSPR
jgi:PelA/Pel-15E family pectate lyase